MSNHLIKSAKLAMVFIILVVVVAHFFGLRLDAKTMTLIFGTLLFMLFIPVME